MIETDNSFAAMDKIFKARSMALVGASGNREKLGFMTLRSIVEGGYDGRIYPINPRGGKILGIRVYPSLDELPETPDLVVIVVPAKFVGSVLRQAAKMGVQGGLILSAGFREAGRYDLEAEIAAIPKESNLRFIGPNVQGINYLPNKMCAMFFPVIRVRGPVAVISQSGTVTTALSEWAADEGMGISAAVNLGNQVDLCESDYLDFFARDENTRAIAMYIEGVKDGKRFTQTLHRVAAKKPVVILKGGKTKAGQQSAASHTGSMAGSHRIFNTACRQFGAIPADDLENLYDASKALTTLAGIKGNRVLCVSTSGGAGTLGADEIEAAGLTLPPLPDALIRILKEKDLPPLATLSNPIDLTTISADEFKKVLAEADKFDAADVFLVCFGDPVEGAVEMIKDLKELLKTPIAVVYFGGGDLEKVGRVEMHKIGIPVFPTPERAMRGIGAGAALTLHRRRHLI